MFLVMENFYLFDLFAFISNHNSTLSYLNVRFMHLMLGNRLDSCFRNCAGAMPTTHIIF